MVRTRCSLVCGHPLASRSGLITTCSLESRTPDHSRCRASTSAPSTAAAASNTPSSAAMTVAARGFGSGILPAADQTFLDRARHQPAIAREHAGAGEAACTGGARALHRVQQPVIHAQRAVKPHGVI